MPTFKDTKDRLWLIDITWATVRRVRDEKDICLAELIKITPEGTDNTQLNRLASDPLFALEVIYAVVRPEAEARGVSLPDFLNALDGDSGDAAITALFEAIANFSPRPLRMLWSKILGVATGQIAAARAQLEDASTDKAIDELLKI